jgi:predicted flap endonuclease-1-like 5' DNA nuclease
MKQFKLSAPNSCTQCGGPTGSHVFAENEDAARAGLGRCGGCANVVTEAAAGDGQAVTNDLTMLRGVGAKRAAEFQTLGIQSFAELAAANPEILAVQLNVKEEDVAKWQEEAARLAEGE